MPSCGDELQLHPDVIFISECLHTSKLCCVRLNHMDELVLSDKPLWLHIAVPTKCFYQCCNQTIASFTSTLDKIALNPKCFRVYITNNELIAG